MQKEATHRLVSFPRFFLESSENTKASGRSSDLFPSANRLPGASPVAKRMVCDAHRTELTAAGLFRTLT